MLRWEKSHFWGGSTDKGTLPTIEENIESANSTLKKKKKSYLE